MDNIELILGGILDKLIAIEELLEKKEEKDNAPLPEYDAKPDADIEAILNYGYNVAIHGEENTWRKNRGE